jgi:hypothetical protein
MNIGIQVETLSGSVKRQLGSDSTMRMIQSPALARGFEPVSLGDERLKVDWLKVGVWTGMLSFVAVFWMGMYTLVVSALR